MKELKTEIEYSEALKRLEQLQDAEPNTTKGNELKQLILSIQDFEDKNYSLPEPTNEDIKQFNIEQLGNG